MSARLNITAEITGLVVKLNTANPDRPFVTIDLDEHGATYISLQARADARALAKAALAAHDLLPEDGTDSEVTP